MVALVGLTREAARTLPRQQGNPMREEEQGLGLLSQPSGEARLREYSVTNLSTSMERNAR